jgi:hypothetical protein
MIGVSIRTPLVVLTAVACLLALLLLGVSSAQAVGAGPGWSIRSLAQPTNFSSTRNAECENHHESEICDRYTLIVQNIGTRASSGPVTISDVLPAGVRAVHISGSDRVPSETNLNCTLKSVSCVDEAPEVSPGDVLVVFVYVVVEPGVSGSPSNSASVAGGGAPTVTTSEQTPVSAEPSAFGVQDFSMQPLDANGQPNMQAGGHPNSLVTSFSLNSIVRERVIGTGELEEAPPEEVKDVAVELPLGFVGDPQATPRCRLVDLPLSATTTACPPASRVGTLVFSGFSGSFRVSEAEHSQVSAVYNMVPEAGYPAEFGFTYLGKMVVMYANVVRVGSSYRLRVTVPGIPELEIMSVSLTFFGDPSARDGGVTPPTPFLTNPVDCGGGSQSAKIEVDTWEHPNLWYSRESVVYPRITGCESLAFAPSLGVTADTTQADEPSGFNVDLGFPQFEEPAHVATPEFRNVTVTLPAGVSISPSAADGLVSCPAGGPEGIDLNGEVEGVDGLEHLAPGGCPAASTIASVEVLTPLLPTPLQGRLYVAQPGCGGAGQPGCTAVDAADGNLFGVYLEAAGQGVVVKLAGSASVSPTTGQVTVSFRENPEFPVSEVKVALKGGPRAVLATPLTCGPATSNADIQPWSSPITPDATLFSAFAVDWDGNGGACPGTSPFAPSFLAETTPSTAGAFSPFTLTLSRSDRQQYISRMSVTTPPGLLGMLSSVTLCGASQAAAGACSAASEIGIATVAAGAGSHPYWVTGHVYLTESYRGAPFGLSIVVPAKAGPFNLGDVDVRATVDVDPVSGALTIVSDPLPQIVDGIPLRVQTINVTVGRPGFIFNPTNCEAHQITASVAGAQGAVAQVSSPFAAAGCRNLSFGPRLTLSTQAKTSKKSGASLLAKVAFTKGQANIRAAKVVLPELLPARLTTIQKACPAATFAANPAACPAASSIGTVKVVTPVLPVVLSGPVYLVSHGGAAFPDLVVVLQGDGVRVDQTASINITRAGVTSSTFANVPDVPLSSFELNFPEGPHSALAAAGSLCAKPLVAPTTLTGQNGLRLQQSIRISVHGCPRVKKRARPKQRPRRK